jgi:beta-galactosidase
VIDSYIFADLHEEERGKYDFSTDVKNLPLFLELAQKNDLYVVLRLGPYTW